jgi:hypothetical protein
MTVVPCYENLAIQGEPGRIEKCTFQYGVLQTFTEFKYLSFSTGQKGQEDEIQRLLRSLHLKIQSRAEFSKLQCNATAVMSSGARQCY